MGGGVFVFLGHSLIIINNLMKLRGFFPKICNLTLTPQSPPTIRHKRVTQFVIKPKTVSTQVFNWPSQTKFIEVLFEVCRKSCIRSNPRKRLLISEIERFNPFDNERHENNFHSLFSGAAKWGNCRTSFFYISINQPWSFRVLWLLQ